MVASLPRYSALAAIVGAVFAPFDQWLIWGFGPTTMVGAVLAVLLLWRHSGNIRKLLDGTESRIGQKAAPTDQA